MSRYDDYENANPLSGTYTYFEPNNTVADPNTITDLFITDGLEAATSSLQLGTDPLETQVIEMGSPGVTTTIYGAMNIIHAINASSITLTNGLNVGGKTTLANVSATELTSTGIDASILKTTTLNATGTTTLGPLYAGNCSLLNVSAASVDLNTLTAVNCSVSNVSVSRLDANTLTASNVSTTNLTVGNVLSAIPIPTTYTNVVDPVGSAISLNTFTYATPNGVAAQTGDFYTYTSTNYQYNMFTGKLNLTPVFAQTTYRVCFSVNALNNPVDLSFQDDAGTLFTLGTITTTPRKKYVFYLKPTVTGPLYLTVSRAALSGAVEIQYDFLSVDAWYETNLSTVNATGGALLASSGGQVGVGTTAPKYTLDVSGTMRVRGGIILTAPITPIYVYPISGVDQIGYTVKVDVPVNATITTAQSTLVTLPSVTSGKWLISFLMMIKGGGSNNIGVNTILFKNSTPLTYTVTAVNTIGINTSNNIVLVDDVAIGSTVIYKINTICNQAHTTSSAFTSVTAPIFTIDNAGYLQATRIA